MNHPSFQVAGYRLQVADICHLQPATCHLQPATCNLQPATCHLQPASGGPLKFSDNILKLLLSFVSLNSRTSVILEEMKKNLTILIAEAALGYANCVGFFLFIPGQFLYPGHSPFGCDVDTTPFIGLPGGRTIVYVQVTLFTHF